VLQNRRPTCAAKIRWHRKTVAKQSKARDRANYRGTVAESPTQGSHGARHFRVFVRRGNHCRFYGPWRLPRGHWLGDFDTCRTPARSRKPAMFTFMAGLPSRPRWPRSWKSMLYCLRRMEALRSSCRGTDRGREQNHDRKNAKYVRNTSFHFLPSPVG
jgi:hypothetical protein